MNEKDTAKIFLEQRGCKVLDENVGGGIGLVAEDGGAIAFVIVRFDGEGKRFFFASEPDGGRKRAKAAALRWMAENEERLSGPVRFDILSLAHLGGGLVAVRRSIGAFALAEKGVETLVRFAAENDGGLPDALLPMSERGRAAYFRRLVADDLAR